jgi:ribosome-binding protein aMBF1 (putative translation factor)
LEEQDRSLHDFGTWMRHERERLGLSLEDVGLVLRMRPARVEMLEDNRAQTTREQRRKLKALFEARDPAARRAKALSELEAMETSGRRVL